MSSNPKSKEPSSAVRIFKSRPVGVSTDAFRCEILGAPLEALLGSASSPLVVEIGCGVGLHPIQYASQFPENRVIAIERTKEKFGKFASRLQAHPELQNRLCAVHGDAVHFLDRSFHDKSIDEVWILYPNPEPKNHTQRWFRSPFMGRLIELMKPDATLFFATNIEEYANEALLWAPRRGLHLERSTTLSNLTHPDWKARTHFEKKYHQRGDKLFDFVFRLNARGVAH